MALISVRSIGDVSWTDLPSPDFNGGYVIGIQDVDAFSTGRDNSGFMHRDRVAVKRKLNLKWSNRKLSEIQDILESAIKDVFFECKYLDPLTGTYNEIVCYCGDASTAYYTTTIGTLTRNFIER